MSKKLYLIHRRDEFRAEESDVAKLKSMKNVEFVLNSQVIKMKGDQFLKSIEVENIDGQRREIDIEGLFVEIGYEVDPTLFKNLLEIDKMNQIKTGGCGETSAPGIFAAGDVTDVPYKQIVISAGEGAKAALCAYNYLHKNN